MRRVGVAAVAAVAVTGGAVAVTGVSGSPPGADDAVAPALVASAGRAAFTVPFPGVGGFVPQVAAPAAPTAPVLDTSALSRAVEQAQADARRLVEAREGRTAGGGVTAGDAASEQIDETGDRTDEDADEQAEAERTAERARRAGRAADPEPAPTATSDCGMSTGKLGAVKTHVRAAAQFLGCAFDQPTVLGVAGRSSASDHPGGRALDFMVDRVTGDQLAACAIRNREALGVSYVIWRQRIDTGSGFRAMPDRGGATANHFDHVHISYDRGAGSGDLTGC